MFKFIRRGVPLLVALGISAALPLVSAAQTASTVAVRPHSGDGATLTVSGSGMRKLTKQGIKLTVKKPGSRAKSAFKLPEVSGHWNFTSATGALTYKGGWLLHLGKRSVTLASVTFSRAGNGSGQVTGVLNGRRVKLFTLTGRVRTQHLGARETLSGLTARLAAPSAKAIDKLLHRGALRGGQILGSFAVTVTNPSSSSQRLHRAVASGVGISFAQQFASLPGGQSLSILPISPSSPGLPGPAGSTTIPGADTTQVTLPLASSSAAAGFDKGTLTGTIPLGGGVELGTGNGSVSLTNPQLTLGTGTEGSGLSFQVNGGPEVKLFSVDTTQLQQAATPNGSLDLKGLLARLSSQGASSLNSALGTNAFTTDQPVGGLTVIVPNKPGQGA